MDILSKIRWKFYDEPSEILNWYFKGKPVPVPHKIKQLTVKHYHRKYNLKNFVETGTFKGYMVNAVKNDFDNIHSIELDDQLYVKAKEKFSSLKHIKIWHGDSSVVLSEVLKILNTPTLFWLDGHFCLDNGKGTGKGELETPIRKELALLKEHSEKHNIQHVILIDDARLFTGEDDYPTLGEVTNLVKSNFPYASMKIRNDIIVIEKNG